MANGIVMDERTGVQLTSGGAITAALLRIGLGLVYLWAFVAAGFGISYANATYNAAGVPTSYGWHFHVDASQGWITSGFKVSPTAGFVNQTHGPLAPLLKHLPTGVDDVGWMIALGGLGIALTLGVFMRIAGWGGLVLNLLIWFSLFPPTNNPVIDAEHMAFGLGILLLMFVHAGNRWGLGRWWSRHTPIWLN